MKVSEALHRAGEHLAAGRTAEAEPLYRRVLAASPNHPRALAGLGVVALRTGHLKEAIDLLRRATAKDPADVESRAALAEALYRDGQKSEGESLFGELLARDPDCLAAINRFSAALYLAGEYERAESLVRRAIELAPDWYLLRRRMGTLLVALSRPREAVEHLRRAIELEPEDADAHMALGQALMFTGDFANAFRETEWRWKLPGESYPDVSCPRWDGRIERGKMLLIFGEEGYGDVIQFSGFLPALVATGINVVLSARPALGPLLRSLRGVRVAKSGDPVLEADYHLPLLSLPLVMNWPIEIVGRATPYLTAERSLVDAWRERLGPRARLRVGIAWAGNPGHQNDAERSIALSALTPLASAGPGIELHSLHVTAESSASIASGELCVRDHAQLLRDFADTAALISNLDLIVSVDTSVAHLAGALRRPVWLMLAHPPDGRWMLGRSDTPWYPTMRLFRQKRPGEWAQVIEEVAAELRAFKPPPPAP